MLKRHTWALSLLYFISLGLKDASSSSTLAATKTASNHPECKAIAPFYWEIGDATGVLASGSIGSKSIAANKSLAIASASKLLFSAYVLEKLNGNLTPSIIKGLNFTSGYSNFSSCLGTLLVGGCYSKRVGHESSHNNKFYYGGGHMQKIASVDLKLAKMGTRALESEIQSYIGKDISLSFSIPQPAGGIRISAQDYGMFLRKILSPSGLKIRDFLGKNSVCTNTNVCSTSIYTPVPLTESWNYSLGHWVESDGTFSSPGLFGFYPWVSASKELYGILSRHDTNNSAYWNSVKCGRLIRKAYITGVQQ